LLEFWAFDPAESHPGDMSSLSSFPANFRRVATSSDGMFHVNIHRPRSLQMVDGRTQSPHLLVIVFARGLLRHLITRVYLSDEANCDSDPVLLEIAPERRSTIIAKADPGQPNLFLWDVILQGRDETVFFAW
jgi:protocatechuate 3,4-dioxygenase alpha subunit